MAIPCIIVESYPEDYTCNDFREMCNDFRECEEWRKNESTIHTESSLALVHDFSANAVPLDRIACWHQFHSYCRFPLVVLGMKTESDVCLDSSDNLTVCIAQIRQHGLAITYLAHLQ